MFIEMPVLSHAKQQEAVDKIHKLMSEGMSSGQAIAIVADELRREAKNEIVIFDFE